MPGGGRECLERARRDPCSAEVLQIRRKRHTFLDHLPPRLPVRPSEQRPQQQLRRPFRDAPRPAGGDPYGYGGLAGALAPGAFAEDGGDSAHEGFRVGGDGTAAQQHEVDVEQPHEIRGTGTEHPRRLIDITARHGGQAQGLDTAPVPAVAGRPVQLDHLMPELPGPGPRPPVHTPADHQPGTEPGPEMQIGKGPALPADGQPERGGVRVLVHHHRHPEPPSQRIPQRKPVPLGKPGDPVQDAVRVIEGTGECHADAEEMSGGGALCDGRRVGGGRGVSETPGTGRPVGVGEEASGGRGSVRCGCRVHGTHRLGWPRGVSETRSVGSAPGTGKPPGVREAPLDAHARGTGVRTATHRTGNVRTTTHRTRNVRTTARRTDSPRATTDTRTRTRTRTRTKTTPRTPAPRHLPHQQLNLPSHRLHDNPGPRPQIQRSAPLPHHRTREIDKHRPQLIPIQMHPHRMPRLRHQPQDRARFPAGGRAPPRLRDEPGVPQPRGDLADGLRGQPGALGEFEPADPVRAGRPQQVEHQRGVMTPHGKQIRPHRTRARHYTPARTHTRTPSRPQTRPATAPAPRTVVHTPIVPTTCTLATALRKWRA